MGLQVSQINWQRPKEVPHVFRLIRAQLQRQVHWIGSHAISLNAERSRALLTQVSVRTKSKMYFILPQYGYLDLGCAASPSPTKLRLLTVVIEELRCTEQFQKPSLAYD
jgi:hypothetical protein